MTERTETLDAMIGAHAAWPNTTERQVFLADVHDYIVDAYAAGGSAGFHRSLFRCVFTEVVRRQGAGLGVDVVDRF